MSGKVSLWLLVLLLGGHESFTLMQKQIFTLEEIVPLSSEFYPDRHVTQWISNSEYIHREYGEGIKKYDAATDMQYTVLSETEMVDIGGRGVASFSKDGKYILMTTDKEKVYRYSSTAEYSIYDIKLRNLRPVDKGRLQVAVWGGSGSLAFVKNNNVYYMRDVTKPEQVDALTTDGVPGEIYYGAADWIYEEEILNAAEALWFSPDGKYLAVASFNDTLVESTSFPYYGKATDLTYQYPKMVEFKYPKAGRRNPDVGLRVFNTNELGAEAYNIPAPVDVVGEDHVLGRVTWASDKNLVVLWLNRRQNVSILVNCDLEKDKCNMVKEQSEPNGWIDINEPFFDDSGSKMVEIQPLFHGDQRFPHAARFDFNTMTTEDLSPGNSTVTSILGWNVKSDTVYYIVSPGNYPWQRQLWSTAGGVVRCINCKLPSCHHVTADFSPDASFAVVTCTASLVPPKILLYSSVTDSFKLIKDSAKLQNKLNQYSLPMTLFSKVPVVDQVLANVKLVIPPNIQPGVKYPMVVKVYAGPGTSRVVDKYEPDLYSVYLANNRSFIVCSIDVRGSGALGTDAMFAVTGALGTLEVTDTLTVIRRLVNLYPFIDPKRVGVWGWSYGGFTTTMMLMRDTERQLSCGAAVAPVTSWLYYDSIYTERYMDTPQSNPGGYRQSNLMLHVPRLRGRRYMLVQGTGDDNVHYQHSMQLAKALQHSDIDFEQVSYTDENHSLSGVSRHFYHALDHFWSKCFR